MDTSKPSDENHLQSNAGAILQQNDDKLQLIKENYRLKEELRLWIHTYEEIINLFRKLIPISDDMVRNSIDKQNTLFKVCRDVMKTIDDPDAMLRQFKSQIRSKPAIKKKPKKKNKDNTFLQNKPYVEQLQSSQLTNRLHDIDKVLSTEIARNKKYLPKNNPNSPIKLNFPPYAELISPSFHEKTKKEVLQTKLDIQDNEKSDEVQIENRKFNSNSLLIDRKSVKIHKDRRKTDQNNRIEKTKR